MKNLLIAMMLVASTTVLAEEAKTAAPAEVECSVDASVDGAKCVVTTTVDTVSDAVSSVWNGITGLFD